MRLAEYLDMTAPEAEPRMELVLWVPASILCFSLARNIRSVN